MQSRKYLTKFRFTGTLIAEIHIGVISEGSRKVNETDNISLPSLGVQCQLHS